jgi:hypothetical protein
MAQLAHGPIVQRYTWAFTRCYPQKKLRLLRARPSGSPEPRVYVEIDGEKGESLELKMLESAAADLERGRI